MRDTYLYRECDVLKNKLGLRDSAKLDKAEVEFSCNALHEIARTPLPGRYDFKHYCEFHAYCFKDIYEWAGEPRTISMEKEEAILGYMSIEYAEPQNIRTEAEKVLMRMNERNWGEMTLTEQAENLSRDMADLWKVHCFREGNTRTTVTFVCQFADEHGMPIERELFERNAPYTRNALVAASAVFADADFRKPEFLINIIKDGLERGRAQERENKQNTMSGWMAEIAKRKAEDSQKQQSSKHKTEKEKTDR